MPDLAPQPEVAPAPTLLSDSDLTRLAALDPAAPTYRAPGKGQPLSPQTRLKIKALAATRKFTQTEIAQRLGCSRQAVAATLQDPIPVAKEIIEAALADAAKSLTLSWKRHPKLALDVLDRHRVLPAPQPTHVQLPAVQIQVNGIALAGLPLPDVGRPTTARSASGERRNELSSYEGEQKPQGNSPESDNGPYVNLQTVEPAQVDARDGLCADAPADVEAADGPPEVRRAIPLGDPTPVVGTHTRGGRVRGVEVGRVGARVDVGAGELPGGGVKARRARRKTMGWSRDVSGQRGTE